MASSLAIGRRRLILVKKRSPKSVSSHLIKPRSGASHAYLGFATPIFQSEMRRIADMLQIRQKKRE